MVIYRCPVKQIDGKDATHSYRTSRGTHLLAALLMALESAAYSAAPAFKQQHYSPCLFSDIIKFDLAYKRFSGLCGNIKTLQLIRSFPCSPDVDCQPCLIPFLGDAQQRPLS